MKLMKILTLTTSMVVLAGLWSTMSTAEETKPAAANPSVTTPAVPLVSVTSNSKKVYGVAVSPFVRKVRVVMIEKSIPYELEEILPTKLLKAMNKDVPESFSKVSPLGKIPAYSEGDFSIADSAVIVDYLDRTHPNPPLYPKDPKAHARADWFHKYADEVVSGVVMSKIFMERVIKPQILGQSANEEGVQEAIQKDLPPIFDYLEKEIGEKKWIVGDDFTMADIALGSQFANLKMAEVTIDAAKYPKLASYIDRIFERESFKKTM